MKSFHARPVSDGVHRLAEGPVWDPGRERVLWVDVDAGHVFEGRLQDGRLDRTGQHSFDGTVGAVVCAADGRLLVAEAQTLTVVALDGTRTRGPRIVPSDRKSRLNDGACDPAGRFLVGSLALDGRAGQETLCRIEADGRLTFLDQDLTLSNGLAWSPDGALLYSVDTIPGIVWIRDYEAASGRCGERREFLRIADGAPDGLCADIDGNLWIALWGAGQVRCYSHDGRHLATVHVAAPNTSSVSFVGPRLDTLLITTAATGLTPEELTAFPDSGRLFAAQVGARGLATTAWSAS